MANYGILVGGPGNNRGYGDRGYHFYMVDYRAHQITCEREDEKE